MKKNVTEQKFKFEKMALLIKTFGAFLNDLKIKFIKSNIRFNY